GLRRVVLAVKLNLLQPVARAVVEGHGQVEDVLVHERFGWERQIRRLVAGLSAGLGAGPGDGDAARGGQTEAPAHQPRPPAPGLLRFRFRHGHCLLRSTAAKFAALNVPRLLLPTNPLPWTPVLRN